MNPKYIQLQAIERTLRDLVLINSVHPAHGGPEGGERRVIDWAAGFLREAGLTPRWFDAAPGRPNLRVRIEGRNQGAPILFCTHVDTVSIGGMTIDPFGAVVRDGRLWGRGATDAKAQVAAMLHAVAAWADPASRPARPLELALVVGEEVDFRGSRALLDQGVEATGIVIGEPTDLRVVTAHKGCVRWWVHFVGKSSHSSKPWLGVNAISAASAFVEEINAGYARTLRERSHPLLDPPTINVSRIDGGRHSNLVPDHCRVQLDRRTIPGENDDSVMREVRSICEKASRCVPDSRFEQEKPSLAANPVWTDPDDPFVRYVRSVAAGMGMDDRPGGVDYATDGSVLVGTGAPVVIAGPGSIDQAHTADEFVELEQVLRGARFYGSLIERSAQL